MRLTPLRRTGLLAAAALAATSMLGLVSAASADDVDSGDPRATGYLKNVDIKHPEACTVGGLTGQTIHPDLFTYTGGDNQLHLNITEVKTNLKVTGIVVKGGPVFNVYLADKLGPLPWNELRAPLKDNGNGSDISHWYGCGVEQTTTTITTTTTTTTTESTVTHSSTPSSATTTTTSETTSSSSGTPATTTTTESTSAFVPVADEDQLASTGFGSPWLLGLGALLLGAGAALVLVVRRRRA